MSRLICYCAFGLVLACCASSSQAVITAGVTLNFDASTDAAGDGTWDPDGTGSSTARNFTFSNGNQSPAVVSEATTPGISAAYAFPAGVATTLDYENFIENTGQGNADATFEMWFRPADTMDNHVLFETGGGTTGSAIQIRGNRVVFNVSDQGDFAVTSAQVLGSLTDRHHQIVGTIDFTGPDSADVSLYVDGQPAHTVNVASGFDDWTGSDDGNLGQRSNAVAGENLGLNMFSDYNGQISIFRFYEGKALTASEVLDNYTTVATAVPVAIQTTPGPSQTAGAVATDLVLNWDAGTPGGSPQLMWEPVVGSENWNHSGTNAPAYIEVNSAVSMLDRAYSFDGSSEMTFSNQWPNQTANSLVEMWVRPGDLMGQEVLFEIGGNTIGSSFALDGDTLQFVAKDNANIGTATFDLSDALASDFIQIAGYFDLNNSMIRLYVNGEEVDDDGVTLSSYAGSDDNALGGTAGQTGGNLSGFGNFTGEISIVRLYTADLTEDEALALVQSNFASLNVPPIPEPTTAALALLGLGALMRRRRSA